MSLGQIAYTTRAHLLAGWSETTFMRWEDLAPTVQKAWDAAVAAAINAQWIPCSERLPTKEDGQVLGWGPGLQTGFVWLSDMPPDCKACELCPPGPHLHGAVWDQTKGMHVHGDRITHWMPAPTRAEKV